MVKIVKQKSHYMCELCFSFNATKEEAEACEKQEPKKITLKASYPLAKGDQRFETDAWKVGDLCIVRIHDDWRRWRMAMIVRETNPRDEHHHAHQILPIFSFLDEAGMRFDILSGGSYPGGRMYDDWKDEDVLILSKEVSDKIIEWSEIIKGLRKEKKKDGGKDDVKL